MLCACCEKPQPAGRVRGARGRVDAQVCHLQDGPPGRLDADGHGPAQHGGEPAGEPAA
jgi:hypothetical protein